MESIGTNDEDLRSHGEYLAALSVCNGGATCEDVLLELEVGDEGICRPRNKSWKCATGVIGSLLDKDAFMDVGSGTNRIDTEYIVESESMVYRVSPFDEILERLPVEEKINRLIEDVRNKSALPFANPLADRLQFLYESIFEDPDEDPVSPGSLKHFISFLNKNKRMRYPDVVLTPSNEIRAQWIDAPNRHFAVTYTETGEVRYVIFRPNSIDPDKIDRMTGITDVETLMEIAQPHRVLEWAST